MSSSLGYTPGNIKDTCSNIQVDLDANVIYANPVGFHQLSTVNMAAAPATLTAQQILFGLINVDAGGSVQNLTMPTAALLVAAMKSPTVSTSIRLLIRNIGGETVTLLASTGTVIAVPDTATIATVQTGQYLIVLTNVTPGSEAATCWTVNSAAIH